MKGEKSKAPKVLLFDIDGVLIFEEKLFSERFSKKHKVPIADILEFFERDFRACLLGKADLKENLKPYLKKWGWKGTTQSLLDYWFAGIKPDRKLFSFAKSVSKKGVALGIASNQDKYRSDHVKSLLGGDSHFKHFFVASALGVKKPQAAFFSKTFRGLAEKMPGLKRDEILFWDDKPKNVLAARKFGMKGEVYRGFPEFRKKMRGYGF